MPSFSPGRSPMRLGNQSLSLQTQQDGNDLSDSNPPRVITLGKSSSSSLLGSSHGSDGLFSIAYSSPRRKPSYSVLKVPPLVPTSFAPAEVKKHVLHLASGSSKDHTDPRTLSLSLPVQTQTLSHQLAFEQGKHAAPKHQLLGSPITSSTGKLEDRDVRVYPDLSKDEISTKPVLQVTGVRQCGVFPADVHSANDGKSNGRLTELFRPRIKTLDHEPHIPATLPRNIDSKQPVDANKADHPLVLPRPITPPKSQNWNLKLDSTKGYLKSTATNSVNDLAEETPVSNLSSHNLAQLINRRSSANRSVGICSQSPLPGWEDDEAPDFFSQFPRVIPELVVWPEVGIAMFANGQSLKRYQALDLYRLMKRERGEMVCRTNVINKTGFLVAYPMGYGKTPLAVALVLFNPPPKNFSGKETSRATLIAVPNKGIMSHWRNEIEKFAPQLRICFFDSSRAILNLNADVILLTYDQLKFQRRCFLEDRKPSHYGHIFRVTFWRVIGDEFHIARNPDTKLATTLLAIRKQHGLCLTGTPAQNSLRDFWVIFKFLGVTYENIDDLSIFDRKIYSKRQKGPIVDPLAKKRLDTILAYFAIFRDPIDPTTGKVLVPIPERTDVTITVTLSGEERMVYEFIKDFPKAPFAKIMRRRQACDHPVLLATALEPTSDTEKDHDEDPDMIATRTEAEINATATEPGWPAELRHCLLTTYTSSKLAIMKGILKGLLPGSKAIVFTNFEKLFLAIACVLENIGIRWVEYSGNMTVMQRDNSLQKIRADPKYTVIIVSIMAGGMGLDITACDTVIVMEPWWNPYAEEQAIARAHRIGQTRPVRVYHLVTENSIEDSIMKTQQVKRETIGGLYGACAAPDDATYATWLTGP